MKDNLFILSEWNSEKCKDTKHSTQRQLEATEKESLYITKKKHKNNIYLKLSKTRSNLKTINKYWNEYYVSQSTLQTEKHGKGRV